MAQEDTFSDEEGYPSASEASAIICAMNTKDTRGEISEQSCFIYFHGKPCYPSCQSDHVDKTMQDLVKRDYDLPACGLGPS
jgi:hypothetical protein